MSWNGSLSGPNWAGNNNGSGGGGSDVGNLYILPNPPTIEENPSIGLEGRNEVPLPTKYKDLDVKNLTAENFNGTAVDITKWANYPAINNVVANLDELGNPQYDLTGFKDIEGTTIKAKATAGIPPAGGTITADISVSSLLGVFTNAEIGTADIGTTNTEALYVDGPTTLDGGLTHGTSIGSLPVGGVNTIRLDVLPVGIDMVSATYITIDAGLNANLTAAGAVEVNAAGAASVAAGGALSLAGGAYIEYNSDQHKFVNTSAGNDFTDIYVGNIHPAEGGSAPLRINGGGSGRGVQIDDGTTITSDNVNPNKLNIKQYIEYPNWDGDITYDTGDIVNVSNVLYQALVINRNFAPTNVVFYAWEYGASYFANEYVSYLVDDAPIIYRAMYDIPESVLSPFGDPSVWALTTIDSPSEIWTQVGTIINKSIVFTPETGEDTYFTIAKPVNEPISIVKRSTLTNVEIDRGTIYDSTFNPPPYNPVAGGDLDMDGYNITNTNAITATTGNIQSVVIPQQDLVDTWDTTTLYTTGNVVVRSGKIYTCNRQNLLVDPSATTIPFWLPDTPYVLNQIITIGSGYNYKCILAYAGSTTTPNVDATHWSNEPDGGMEVYWSYVRDALNGSIKFTPLTADTTYWSLIKQTAEDGLYIVERDKTTNEIVSSGRIYDTENYPPPPFDPSITTDLNMNNYDINNVGTLRTNNIGVGSIGTSIVMKDDISSLGKSILDFNFIDLKGKTGDDGMLEIKDSSNTIRTQLSASNTTGNTTLFASDQLILSANSGVSAGNSLTTPIFTAGTIGGISGGPVDLSSSIAAEGYSITGLNQITAASIGAVAGTLNLYSPVDANENDITNLSKVGITGSSASGFETAKLQMTDLFGPATGTLEYQSGNGFIFDKNVSSTAEISASQLNAPTITADIIKSYGGDGVEIQNTLDVKTTDSGILSAINIRNSANDIALTITNSADETQSADIGCYGALQIGAATSVSILGATGAVLGALTGNVVVGAEDGEATFGGSGDATIASTAGFANIYGVGGVVLGSSTGDVNIESTTGTIYLAGDAGVDISSASGVIQTNAGIMAKKPINVEGSMATYPALVGLTDTPSNKQGGMLMDGTTFSVLTDSDMNIQANGGDMNLTATGDINIASVKINTDDISNVDSISLYYSKYGIPDSADFAWFRRMYTYFSYSNNAGATWRPVAQDWSSFSAEADVDWAGYSITGLTKIFTDNIEGSTTDTISFNSSNLTDILTINSNPILKYGEFASNTQQTLVAANDPTQVVFDFDTGNAGATGFTLDTGGNIVCANSGVYRVILEIFFSKATGGTAHTDTWFQINGTDVPYSNNQYHFSGTGERESLTITRVLTLNATDTLSVYWASDNANVVLEPNAAQTTPFAHPESPSVLINLVCV